MPDLAGNAIRYDSRRKIIMAAKRPDFPTLLGMYVAAEHHQCLDCLGHERGRLMDIGERVWTGSGGLGVPGSGGIDLRFDHAGVAVVDGAENRDGAAVPTRVPDEQLARAGRPGLRGRVGHDPVRAAFWAACATVSLSAKPLIRATSAAGRV